jgi:hypothetical protein
MFYYEIESNLKLSILQQQYSGELFNLVDQNREYLRQCCHGWTLQRMLKIQNLL